MRPIDADLLPIQTVGICDAHGNMYGAADVVFAYEIINAPTIDPVKHGRWKEITYHNGCTPDYDCVCSECGTSGVPYYEYCPGCGARMDANE